MKPRIYRCSRDGVSIFINLDKIIAVEEFGEKAFIFLDTHTFFVDQSYELILEAWRNWSTT